MNTTNNEPPLIRVWFQSTATPLYEGMHRNTLLADTRIVREAIKQFCLANDDELESYGFLVEANNGELYCPEISDDTDYEQLEAQFLDGGLGFYFEFDGDLLEPTDTHSLQRRYMELLHMVHMATQEIATN